MGYLFTSESVSEGHPDKVADQISDAVLDKLLAYDPSSKVACETLVTTGQVVLAGEVKTKAYVDLQLIAREVIQKIGYTKGVGRGAANIGRKHSAQDILDCYADARRAGHEDIIVPCVCRPVCPILTSI